MSDYIQKESGEIIADSYVQIAKYVAQTRAFPSILDGMKTVYHRMIYASKDMKSKVKSNIITAETMKYHPHGECLSGNTKFLLRDGKYLSIEEMYNIGGSFDTLSINLETGEVEPSSIFDIRIGQFSKKLYKITCNDGNEVVVTGNHPILLSNLKFKRADELKVGDELYSGYYDGQEWIYSAFTKSRNQVHRLVGSKYLRDLNKDESYHHINGNHFDNSTSNIMILTNSEHAKVHGFYIKGFENGRKSMFDDNGTHRTETIKKNSELMSSFNRDQGFRRFKNVIQYMKLNNIELTVENYESLRNQKLFYNQPFISRLISKGYGSSFEELVLNELPSIGEIYRDNHPIVKQNKSKNRNRTCCYKVMSKNARNFSIIENISIECYDEEIPMYDFSSDTYHNALILTNKRNDCYKYLCVHNCYGVLVSMACKFGKLPLFTSYGNFGGGGFNASASRYTSAVLNDIGRLMYLELVDYADYIEGDAGLMEPKYLPSLIPYALITGDRGMTVGLPTPEIPSFNLIELIEYCKCTLMNKECKYPRPDYGDCILNCSQEDLKPLYETGKGTIWYKVKFTVIDNKIIVTDLPPGHRHWTAWKKIKHHIDSGAIDFLEDVDENGQRYEYILNDPSKISMDELLQIFNRYADSKVTYRMYFEENGSVYLCPFNFIIKKSQAYLKKCAIRKFEKELSNIEFRIEILKALKMLRESEEIQDISKKSSQFFKELIQSWGFSKVVADNVMGKSISYLTTSHDAEFDEIFKQRDYLLRMKNDPTEYLIGLYDRLIELVTPLYTSRRHSDWIANIANSDQIGYWWYPNEQRIETGLISDDFLPFNGMLYEVYPDGMVNSKFVNKELDLDIESDAMVVVACQKPKYLIYTWHNYISVIPVSKISKNSYVIKVWDGYEMDSAFLAESDNVKIKCGSEVKELYLPDWVKKRISLPQKAFKKDGFVKEVISID